MFIEVNSIHGGLLPPSLLALCSLIWFDFNAIYSYNVTLWQALIACATRLHEVQNSAEFGVGISGEVSVDFGKVMNRMRRIRSEISEVRETK